MIDAKIIRRQQISEDDFDFKLYNYTEDSLVEFIVVTMCVCVCVPLKRM